MRILNIIGDYKLADSLIDVQESLSKNDIFNDYIIVADKRNYQLKNIEKNKDKIKSLNECEAILYINNGDFDAVFMHSLNSEGILQQIQNKVLVFWFAWGFDIYTMPIYKPFIPIHLYCPLTKKLMSGTLIDRLRHFHAFIDSYAKKKLIKKDVYRVDYFSGVLPEEYALMKKNTFFKAKQVVYNYFSLNTYIKKENISQPFAKGNGIQVGNSANPTNNHLDLYELLHQLDINDKVIYSFLSYSGTEKYARIVKERGESYWGDKYKGIMDFLPYEEYAKIVNTCTNVIMGHKRQQAMGNIYQALWSGCKLFLPKDSVTYISLRNAGYVVFSIEDNLINDELNSELSSADRMKNRSIMLQGHSLQAHLRNINNIIDIINDKKSNDN